MNERPDIVGCFGQSERVCLKRNAIRGSIWNFFTHIGDQIVALLVQIVLARLLLPEDFGVVALLSIFLTISKVLTSGGFAAALIQKQDADELDFNSVFYAMLSLSAFMYAVLFVVAPGISLFYDRPIVCPLLRVLALQLFFSGVNGVQNAHLARRLKMKEGFFISLPAVIATGIVGIGMAYRGFGPWALCGGALAGGFVGTALRWFLIGWRPKLQFSFHRLQSLFSFGSRLLLTGFLETFSNQVYGLVIGKWYSPGELAYFNRGETMPHMLLNSIHGAIGNVAFPVLSRLQTNRTILRRAMRKILRMLSFLVFPLLFGLGAAAEPVVRIVLTDKWLPAVPFLRLACFAYAFGPIYMLNSQVMNALGRSDLYLHLEIAKKMILFVLLFATIPFGPLAMAVGKTACAVLFAVINAWPNRLLIRYSIRSQFWDVAASGILALAMAIVVLAVSLIGWPPLPTLCVQILVGLIVYGGGAVLFKTPGLDDILSLIPKTDFKRIDRARTLQP